MERTMESRRATYAEIKRAKAARRRARVLRDMATAVFKMILFCFAAIGFFAAFLSIFEMGTAMVATMMVIFFLMATPAGFGE